MIETVELQSSTDWVARRDMAVVTLLYGCGLRISEALSLTGRDLPLGDAIRITGKGGKERVVPVIPAARRAMDAYLAACPFEPSPDQPLFRGTRGGPLNPRLIQKVMEKSARAAWPSGHGHAACHAAQLRDPSSERRRRSSRDPGASGPRLAVDDAGLYRCRHGAIDGGL